MDPGIFRSSGDRPGFGPESQKYGDPRPEILGFRGQPGTASCAGEDDPNHSSLLRGLKLFSYLLMVEGMAVLLTASLLMCCWLWSVCAQQGFAYI